MKHRVRKSMPDESANAWLKGTLLYRDWQAQKAEILKHKWIESQKVGYDIGWNRAMVDWLARCSNEYRRAAHCAEGGGEDE